MLYSECVNGSLLCTGRSCRENCTGDEYRCPGEDRCIPLHYRCDGIVDCASKLDEIGCGQSVSQSVSRSLVFTRTHAHTHTHIHPFNGPLSGTTPVSRYRKGQTNLDFTEARDSEWQWHQLGHMLVCTSLQADNHASTPPLCFFTGPMPFLPPNQQCQSTEGS